jgi:hypothetical protein
MCDICEDADRRIAHYMLLSRSVMDGAAFHRIAEIIAEIRAEKAARHRDNQPVISRVAISEPTAD